MKHHQLDACGAYIDMKRSGVKQAIDFLLCVKTVLMIFGGCARRHP